MKRSRVIFLLVLFFPLMNILGENEQIAKGRVEGEVYPKGNGDTVFVYQNDSSIEVEFLTALSNITITIEDANGVVVFSTVINTTAGMVYIIDVSNFETGWYNIRIESKSGGTVKGSFYVD